MLVHKNKNEIVVKVEVLLRNTWKMTQILFIQLELVQNNEVRIIEFSTIESVLDCMNNWIVSNIKKKSKVMKIFAKIQKYLLMLGIKPNESYSFNWKVLMVFLAFGFYILSNVMLSISMENPTLMDHLKNFTRISSIASLGISLAAIISQQVKIFEAIGSIERLINESMNRYLFLLSLCWRGKQSLNKKKKKISGLEHTTSKAFYEKTNRRVERISGNVYFVLVKVLPQYAWLICVISFVKYYSTGFDGVAFELPGPMW